MAAEEFRYVDLERKEHSLSQYHGKVVLVYFWTMRCKLCITKEMAAVQVSYDKLRDKGFVVLAINEVQESVWSRRYAVQCVHRRAGRGWEIQQWRFPDGAGDPRNGGAYSGVDQVIM